MGNARLQKVREIRQRTLEMVVHLDEAQFSQIPPEEEWSPGQVIDHLIKSDRMYLEEIEKLVDLQKAGKSPRITVSLSEMKFPIPFLPRFFLPLADIPVSIFNFFLPNAARQMILSNPLIPAQTAPILEPTRGREKGELLDEFKASLETIESLFRDHPEIDFSRLRYYHPLFGYNNVFDILGLLSSHERRHQQQLNRMRGRMALGNEVRIQNPESRI